MRHRDNRVVGIEDTAHEIVGKSPAIQKLLGDIQVCAASRSTVLITAETGTGKNLVAKAIHFHPQSPRGRHRFVSVDCNGIPETLVDSELFGHYRGTFTGANTDAAGKFEQADQGTIVLDEIGELSLHVQSRLLHVLQEREVQKLGGRPVKVDVRVIAATNVDLEERVRMGAFRKDLFYRLNVIRLELPPLRAHSEDIRLLAEHFLRKFAAEAGKPVTDISDDVMRQLRRHQWPGNIRELSNVIERAVDFAQGQTIEAGDIDPAYMKHGARTDGKAILEPETIKRRFLEDPTLTARKLAPELGYSPDYLYQWLSKQRISVRDLRRTPGPVATADHATTLQSHAVLAAPKKDLI